MNEIIKKVIENEGGIDNLYYADGYHTVAGICFEYHRDFFASWGIDNPEDIANLPHAGRYGFYTQYFDDCYADRILSEPLQYAHFDHCFNTGISNGIKLLQNTLNLANFGSYPLNVDGIFGPKTYNSLVLSDVQGREVALAEIYNGLRRKDYWEKYLKAKRGRPAKALDFLHSWMGRVIILD